MLAYRLLIQLGIGHIVGRQIAVIPLTLGGADHMPDPRERGQPVFNFAQLDTETADLDLGIVAPEELYGAIRQEASQIAGQVHQRIG